MSVVIALYDQALSRQAPDTHIITMPVVIALYDQALSRQAPDTHTHHYNACCNRFI